MSYIPYAALIALGCYAIYGVATGTSVNFALILFLLVCVTGIAWALDKWVWSKSRAKDELAPSHIDVPVSVFPVFLIVFLLRSFIAEPFRIPSSSMRPTLEVGDFILVNKFAYGIRLPIVDKKVIDLGSPKRGDVVVFRYPVNPSDDYIKRVVGVPGDTVTYKNKQLSINNVPAAQIPVGPYSYVAEDQRQFVTHDRVTEKLGDTPHDIAINTQAPSVNPGAVFEFKGKQGCQYFGPEGFSCVVPPESYFMMGDNRDNSLDSRYWGFVPDSHLRGRAFFIWFNWADAVGLNFKRIGSSVR
jgi:signal peptidase I